MEQEKNFRHICTAGLEKEIIFKADMSSADICMKEINDTEYLLKAIAYVLRNPSAAGLAVHPTLYRWGSGPLYFNGGNTLAVNTPVTDIAHLSTRQQQKLFRSRRQLPGHYTVTADGLICPEYYADYRSVEELFRTPVRMLKSYDTRSQSNIRKAQPYPQPNNGKLCHTPISLHTDIQGYTNQS